MKRKPPFVSHYLVLRDLINGVDVRSHSDVVAYHCSRIENIKCELIRQGLRFQESAHTDSKYSYYKPYILETDEANMRQAKKLLERYETAEVVCFLEGAA